MRAGRLKKATIGLCAFIFLLRPYNTAASWIYSILRKISMPQRYLLVRLALCLIAGLPLSGCVERKLTINTEPQGALVILNDEEIGESPTTVGFQWYGDYTVRISKLGYETLSTHRELKGPWYDVFPFDFFAQIVNPNRIVDSYEWTFELSPKRQISAEELIERAEAAKSQLQ
jgi:hypothetical protein